MSRDAWVALVKPKANGFAWAALKMSFRPSRSIVTSQALLELVEPGTELGVDRQREGVEAVALGLGKTEEAGTWPSSGRSETRKVFPPAAARLVTAAAMLLTGTAGSVWPSKTSLPPAIRVKSWLAVGVWPER